MFIKLFARFASTWVPHTISDLSLDDNDSDEDDDGCDDDEGDGDGGGAVDAGAGVDVDVGDDKVDTAQRSCQHPITGLVNG